MNFEIQIETLPALAIFAFRIQMKDCSRITIGVS